MSTAKDSDSPAFPIWDSQHVHAVAMAASIHIEDAAERERAYIEARGKALTGISMRDYFAAKAMQGELASQSPAGGDDYNYLPGDEEDLATWCYRMADAMLKARAR